MEGGFFSARAESIRNSSRTGNVQPSIAAAL